MSFSAFWVILGDIDPENLFKKSKTSCTVFFWDVLRGKKSKILRITARSIWAGMLYIIYLFIYSKAENMDLMMDNGFQKFVITNIPKRNVSGTKIANESNLDT